MAHSEPAGLSLRGLTKKFGDFTAVDSVNLTVNPGDVLCLLGPSGCGKTTTLRMIAGLEEANEGTISVDGRSINNLSTRERNMAMSFQFYALYPSLSVRENLVAPLTAEGLSGVEVQSRLDKIAEMMALDGVLDRFPHQLSEGEKQRVSVGRCIIRNATCFLFDEPLSRLDVRLREAMRGEIANVLSDLSKPVVIVTHDQVEALTMATHIAVMRDGQIEQYGTPDDLFFNPINTFVAGFIGAPGMNLISTQVICNDSVSIGSQKIVVPKKIQSIIEEKSEVTLGFRPRSASISNNAKGLRGQVELIEPMGDSMLVHVNSGIEGTIQIIVDSTSVLNPRDEVAISIDPDGWHVFDAEGKAIQL